VALAFAGFAAVLATGVLPSASAAATSPPDPGDQWAAAAFFLVIAVSCAVFMVRAARRQLREHPPSAEQPSEVGLAPD
jgi:hypothetical protein